MVMHDYDAVVECLRARLAGDDLPGPAAQGMMSARPVSPDWETDLSKIPAGTRHAGVLVLLHPRGGRGSGTALTLTRRAGTLGSHRRQISFPGGALEVGETPAAGALREANEEVGLEPSSVEVLGALTPLHIPISRFLAHPVVATAAAPPPLRPEPTEVAAILEAHVHELVAPGATRWDWDDRPRGRLHIPSFSVGGVRVWGATAMMLSELLAILGWEGPPPPAPP
jgi:8-oxo-dGTP pyrophosphatase MutT (NUDIX family)